MGEKDSRHKAWMRFFKTAEWLKYITLAIAGAGIIYGILMLVGVFYTSFSKLSGVFPH